MKIFMVLFVLCSAVSAQTPVNVRIDGAANVLDVSTEPMQAAPGTTVEVVLDPGPAIVPLDDMGASLFRLQAGRLLRQAPTNSTVAFAVNRARKMRIARIMALHSEILALERELSQDTTHATVINSMIAANQTKIETLR